MKVEDHATKISRLEHTLAKLNDEEDHEAIIEIILLLAAHYVNAGLHAVGKLRVDRDIRHNRLHGELRRGQYFGVESGRIADLLDALERMRPSQIYGKGEDGEAARRAREIYGDIREYCKGVLDVG